MTQARIEVFPDLAELSRAAALRFTELARESNREGKVFAAALSGGSTPQMFLEMLAEPEFAQRITWENVHLFQVDERCVPPDNLQSNYRMIRSSLLIKVAGAAESFHRMKAEDEDRDAASAEYEDEIREILAPAGGALPRFDLVFLGLGPDGHTASLFPGSPALEESRRWVCPNYVEKFQMHRLTLTYPILNAAREVVFLVSGASKAEILRQVLEGPRDRNRLPAQGIEPVDGSLVWYVDKAAAQLLDERRAYRKTR